ncbi:MAG: GNAT family N-acetyltransferase [Candidatus Pacearchaeota archaeon]
MLIRKAKEEDRKQIIKLVDTLYCNSPFMKKEWRKKFNEFILATFVVEIKKKIVGYIAFGFTKDSVYIGDLYILPEHRRKGLATRLLKVVEKIKEKFKKENILVDFREHNRGARKFYEKHGFKFLKKFGKLNHNLLRFRK